MEMSDQLHVPAALPPGKETLVRQDNIRMDLRETGWEGVDWIHIPQDRDQ
jgi:hypothetical protein